MHLLFYVSGHGFGHASRMTALFRALRERAGQDVRIEVRSDAPDWIFRDRDPDVVCSHAEVDIGVLQPNGLDLDLPGTLAAHEKRLDEWEQRVECEAVFIHDRRPDLVVGDIPPLAFEAAARADVPSVAIANFSWDWILEAYAEREPRWEPVLACYRAAYGHAQRLFRLPMHGEFPSFRDITDVPLLVRRSTRGRESVRRELGIELTERRPLVLVSFGGFGHAARDGAEGDDLSDFLFVGFGEKPPGFRGTWIALPHRSPIPHEDLVAASDVVLGKPGYGTVAEVLAHGTRFLYVPRDNFREMPILTDAVSTRGCARQISRPCFEANSWRYPLHGLLAFPKEHCSLHTNGDVVITNALCGFLRTSSKTSAL